MTMNRDKARDLRAALLVVRSHGLMSERDYQRALTRVAIAYGLGPEDAAAVSEMLTRQATEDMIGITLNKFFRDYDRHKGFPYGPFREAKKRREPSELIPRPGQRAVKANVLRKREALAEFMRTGLWPKDEKGRPIT